MTKKEKLQHILETLDKIYGTTKDGFYHNQDWQLLTAIMLSAQSTDKQVDEALPGLFGRFRTAEEVAQAPVEEIEEYIRSVGLYKNKAKNMKKCCEQLVKDYGGKVPDTQELMKVLPRDHWNRINFQLIYLGREICTARKAKCTQCPLQEWCEKNL